MDTLKITKQILNKYNLKANKRFGQNFWTANKKLSKAFLFVATSCRTNSVIPFQRPLPPFTYMDWDYEMGKMPKTKNLTKLVTY